MDATTDTKMDATTDTKRSLPDKWWQFKPGNKTRTQFKPGHPPYPPPAGTTELTRLKRRIARELKAEYGPELTGSQLAYINAAAEAGARLQLQPQDAHPLAIANLMDAQRHALQALEGD